MIRTATISPCETYRYNLRRSWVGESIFVGPFTPKRIVWVMLNPSTADGREDDATIRRIVDFSELWGFEILDVVNLFALRSKDPRELRKAVDPIGPENDRYILDAVNGADQVVAAWGKDGALLSCASAVRVLVRQAGVALHHLGLNADGSPKHPLYLKRDTRPREWA